MENLKNLLPQKFKNIYHLYISHFASIIYGFPANQLRVIGVTGTDGKTTTANLIYTILRKSGRRVGVISTVNCIINGKKYDTGLHVTNPAPFLLQKLLRQMVKDRCKFAIVEVTSHGLDQNRVSGINFEVGVLTNVTNEHLNYHKSFDNYLNTKVKLLKRSKFCVLNRDDGSFKIVITKLGGVDNIINYGFNRKSDYRCSSVKEVRDGMEVSVIAEGAAKRMETCLLGHYNVSNILAGVATARILGLSWQTISEGVSSFHSPEGRLEKINNKLGISIYVDFAHTPNALENLLRMLKKYTDKRLICVLGCAGQRDTQKREIMGMIAMTYSDVVVFTAEDPRYEDVDEIIKEMVKGAKPISLIKGSSYKSYLCIPERGKAIHASIMRLAKPGDTVVICGKGHEKSMNYNGIEYPWSDKLAVKMALKNQIYTIKLN